MRRLLPLLVTAAVLAAVVIPARAADTGVTVTDNAFVDAHLTIDRGDTVTWVYDGAAKGSHNVHFADGKLDAPANPSPGSGWPPNGVARTFDEAGDRVYTYWCQLHGSETKGMRGTVAVDDPNVAGTPTPEPSTTAQPSTTAEPSTTAQPSSTATVEPSSTPTPAPVSFTARTRAKTFCNTRSSTCRRLGIRLVVDLQGDRGATLVGRLRRRSGKRHRPAGSIVFDVQPGRHTYRIRTKSSGKRITAGRYRLRLTVAGGGSVVRLRFRVR